MTTPDPVRWLESDEPSLTAEQHRALRVFAARAPSVAQRARVLDRLEGVPVAVPAASASPARRAWWWSAGGMLVLGAFLLAQLGRLAPVAERRPTPPLQPALPAPAHPVTRSVPEPARPPSPPVAPSASAPPSGARRAHGSRTTSAAAQDPVAELALLTPARQLLATDPARSLTLAEEHARRFPRGLFAEERAFLRIDALLRLGQRGRAESEARAFRRSHPQSSYLERLDGVLPAGKSSDGVR